jgi:class 3 adenylate cyclase
VAEASAALPSGVVTFLLTDVEESTRLWEQDAAAMEAALARHDDILADAVTAHGGVLLKHKGEGDSTFSVFGRASDAVAAAVAAQHALTTESLLDEVALSVRVAVHTGEAVERSGDYFGRTVNRAARLRSIAEGGHILVSQSTADLVRDDLPPQHALAALGEF